MSDFSDARLPFGLKGNQMVHIDDVENGLSCDCICPGCKEPLVAKNKGQFKAHHFAHQTSEHNCQHGLESAVHQYAKQVIKEAGYVWLPDYEYRETRRDDLGLTHSESKHYPAVKTGFTDIQLEQKVEDFRPDILGIGQEKVVHVEIFYRHKVDEAKANKVREGNHWMIEIDLSTVKATDLLDKSAFKRKVLDEMGVRRWIHRPIPDEDVQSLRAALQKRIDAMSPKQANKSSTNHPSEAKETHLLGADLLPTAFPFPKAYQRVQEDPAMYWNNRYAEQLGQPWHERHELFSIPIANCNAELASIWQVELFMEFIHSGYCEIRYDDVYEWAIRHFILCREDEPERLIEVYLNELKNRQLIAVSRYVFYTIYRCCFCDLDSYDEFRTSGIYRGDDVHLMQERRRRERFKNYHSRTRARGAVIVTKEEQLLAAGCHDINRCMECWEPQLREHDHCQICESKKLSAENLAEGNRENLIIRYSFIPQVAAVVPGMYLRG